MNTAKARILVAEPDPDIQKTLQLYFETYGHEVQAVGLAREVIKFARPWQPNVILLSSDFIDRNPYEVCQNLMEDTLTGHIPVVMLLRLNEREARLTALEAGASHVVTQPFDLEELRLRVEAAVRLATISLSV